jgi:hypothetical protein
MAAVLKVLEISQIKYAQSPKILVSMFWGGQCKLSLCVLRRCWDGRWDYWACPEITWVINGYTGHPHQRKQRSNKWLQYCCSNKSHVNDATTNCEDLVHPTFYNIVACRLVVARQRPRCCCEKLVAEAGDISGPQKKVNLRRWKPLPSNGSENMYTSLCVCVCV